ncbi:MAG: 4Fe-4S dicluster domain-containing protein [Chloroflexi bacterium]|jgi:anaerobic carbon-monoxide dehydrogenase iron sulfur subunit|nr:4Fe-4S dicluster domain-containing protein [Chloroflexota bacterium]MBT7082228.1 4Fe-4S dicluster domain-containing protein [Chloroflexota bacterium]MBT7290418.1 4Fe-4S dicluster domain-containing protein [Chloroflexota bacterium]
MAKTISVDSSKCTGCRLCELVCSVKNEGIANPYLARIHVVKWEFECFEIPMLCRQCDVPFCTAVCPVNALYKDEALGRVVVDYDRCVGCRMCVLACPFGGMKYDTKGQKVTKCQLCDGDPTCVKFCDTQALQYVDAGDIDLNKQREYAARSYQQQKEYKESIGPEVGHPGPADTVAPGWGRWKGGE